MYSAAHGSVTLSQHRLKRGRYRLFRPDSWITRWMVLRKSGFVTSPARPVLLKALNGDGQMTSSTALLSWMKTSSSIQFPVRLCRPPAGKPTVEFSGYSTNNACPICGGHGIIWPTSIERRMGWNVIASSTSGDRTPFMISGTAVPAMCLPPAPWGYPAVLCASPSWPEW